MTRRDGLAALEVGVAGDDGGGVFFCTAEQGFLQTGVDNAAHVGGLLAGALMGCILPVRPDLLQALPQARKRALLALAACWPGTHERAVAETVCRDQKRVANRIQGKGEAWGRGRNNGVHS